MEHDEIEWQWEFLKNPTPVQKNRKGMAQKSILLMLD